jgi:ankyrin repeat protein
MHRREFVKSTGLDVNAKDDVGEPALHHAASQGHKEIVELLIAKGADVNAKKNSDQTLLHTAATNGKKETVELLIAADADVNAKAKDGKTPLDMANGAITDLLRKHGGKTGEELKAEGK